MRSVWILVAGLALTACTTGQSGETSASEPSSTTLESVTDQPTQGEAGPSATTVIASPSTTVVASVTTTSVVDPELLVVIDGLVEMAEILRQLEFVEPPIVTVVTPAELADRVRTLIEDELDPEDVARDEALMRSLGVLSETTELGALYADLYSEQVQGYYDGDTGELVVPSSGSELDPLQKMVLVHELVHALTDQVFDFHERLSALDDADDFEGSAALRSLVEGDATYTSALYFWQLPESEQQLGLSLMSSATTDTLDAAPSFITDLLQFPYNEGARFATTLATSGGFAELNAAYDLPPTTTEQIYRLEAFRLGEAPVTVDLAELDIGGYDLGESGVWGQAGFDALFEQTVGRLGRQAAPGWGGDRYQVYWNGTDSLFVMKVVGDTEVDTDEFQEAWRSLALSTPEGTVARVERSGSEVVVVISADAEAAGAAAAQLGMSSLP